MGMPKSPHRKQRPPLPVSTRSSGSYQGTGIWLPLGKRAGTSAKHGSGNEPGKSFKDPKGRVHIVPNKSKKKRAEKKQRSG